jgi:hypothetical protein
LCCEPEPAPIVSCACWQTCITASVLPLAYGTELAALIPALIPALSRDSLPSDGRTALSAGTVVNPDVLHAMIILADEIPAACAAACEVTGEPWQHRPSAICLRAIPRLHHRLTALGMPAAASDLETGMHHWTRMVKLALGLRTPDIPVGWD